MSRVKSAFRTPGRLERKEGAGVQLETEDHLAAGQVLQPTSLGLRGLREFRVQGLGFRVLC